MKSFYKLENRIRDYAWGHPTDIPSFMGIDWPADKPAAELWMGAHPGAPSAVVDGSGEKTDLDQFIIESTEASLGADVAGEYGGLPFLFKLLAAGKSLSIQAHPDKKTAEEGFARENDLGIPVDAPTRNYKDDNHKPEIIMAITNFTAMIGFREPVQVAGVFGDLQDRSGVKTVGDDVLRELGAGEESALKDFLGAILNAPAVDVASLLETAAAGSDSWDDLQKTWVPNLARQFPGDVGALAPLFLNLVELSPGDALYQPARALHAYLSGFGLELMANSDNVLRGGLTPKNVDVPELLSVLDFESVSPAVIGTDEPEGGLAAFDTPAREFTLALGEPSGDPFVLEAGRGPEILLVMEGTAVLDDGREKLEIRKGESSFLPSDRSDVSVTGSGRIALAGVGS